MLLPWQIYNRAGYLVARAVSADVAGRFVAVLGDGAQVRDDAGRIVWRQGTDRGSPEEREHTIAHRSLDVR